MPQYRLPALPHGIAVDYFSLSVRGDVEIPTNHLSRIRAAAGQTVEEPHLSLRANLQGVGYTADIFGLIGVHTSSRQERRTEQQHLASAGGEALADTFEVHYEFVLRPQSSSTEKIDPNWDTLIRVLESVMPAHSAQVELLVVALRDEFSFPIAVPLPLNPTDVPGFSEIRGLRLVQPDPVDSEVELYYAILDQSGDRRSVQVSSPVEVEWTENILHDAMTHALSILEIAIRRPIEREGF